MRRDDCDSVGDEFCDRVASAEIASMVSKKLWLCEHGITK